MMNSIFSLIFLASLLSSACALYEDDPHVKVFNKKSDFEEQVLQSDGIWMLQFYAPWCGHCQQLAPIYKLMAGISKGVFRLAAMDTSAGLGQRMANSYGVEGFPSMYLFGYDKTKPKKYEGNRDLNSMVRALTDELSDLFQKRMQNSGAGGQQQPPKKKASDKSHVVNLSSDDFQAKIIDNPQVSMVAFVAPWCGHCKQLLPEWEEAAEQLANEDVVLGLVDATVNKELAQSYGVTGYPTIKVFSGGKSSVVTDYQGQRTASAIVKAILEEVDRTGVPKQISELTNTTIFTETCKGTNRICILAALPHISESGVEGRNKYRDMMSAVSKTFRGTVFSFLWVEGGAQYELEQAMELSFGYPALVALSLDRQAYSVLRGSFSEKSITSFLRSITSGRQATVKLANDLPAVLTVEPWDGKEAALPEEELSLADIMGWGDEAEL